MLQQLDPERLKRILHNARQQAETLAAAIDAQDGEATEHQHAKLASLYMLIYDLENPDEEELY